MQIATASPLPIPPAQLQAGIATRPSPPAGSATQRPDGAPVPRAGSETPGVAGGGQPASVGQAERLSTQTTVRASGRVQGDTERSLLSALLDQMGGSGDSALGRIIDTFV